ncbi:hypothetical protein DUNSADRAFT_2630 [Dunaliella salina]|uniref:Encoded protein n=1 Tax=Dunaliella salina TaxID=3046 RepID=A0ABQ7FW96_DUNSA|nr:hypothetical protein DUNSADRAFT_2630 [Dunaliella salina]|eukprot:KAF5826586.1 hypothetical protein DUNSADRAFT_2630 [Dunaliella salina]
MQQIQITAPPYQSRLSRRRTPNLFLQKHHASTTDLDIVLDPKLTMLQKPGKHSEALSKQSKNKEIRCYSNTCSMSKTVLNFGVKCQQWRILPVLTAEVLTLLLHEKSLEDTT